MFVRAGHELLMLAESFPDDRQIIGIDLAEGMVDRANARCKEAGIRWATLLWSASDLPHATEGHARCGVIPCAVEEPEP